MHNTRIECAKPLDGIRESRTQAIREQMALPRFPRFIYLLLEPEVDVIRYVGICRDPVARFGTHTSPNKHSSPGPVRRWIESLMQGGELPRMEVVGTVTGVGVSCDQIVCLAAMGEAIEKELIYRIRNGVWCGNRILGMQKDLLNVRGLNGARSRNV